MGIKIGSTRIGHRIGGFYVSTPITGRNAGQVRVGHKLPGGFYGSTAITATDTRGCPAARTRNAAPTKAVTNSSRAIAVLMIIISIGVTVAFWPIGVPMLILFTLAYMGSFVGKDGKMHFRN